MFVVANEWSKLILMLADSHLLEGKKGGKDRTSSAEKVFGLGGAMILIFIVLSARAVTPFCTLLMMPEYIKVPLDRTVKVYRSYRSNIALHD